MIDKVCPAMILPQVSKFAWNGSILILLPLAALAQVKVFLLAGQSNMVGMASVQHLEILINDHNITHNDFREDLWNGTGFRSRDDVFVKYNDRVGKLEPGYGASVSKFGPELGFGWTVGDAFTDNPLGGGRNLAVDFRPPLSGEGQFPDVKPSKYGWEYRQMIHAILDGLEAIQEIYPDYCEDQGYQLCGFVWFQGWNDMLSWPFVREYGFNLANLIRDIRRETDEPSLPFVVGELGMHGNLTGDHSTAATRVKTIRAMEQGVTLLSEFQNNTIFVKTSPYVINNGTKYNKIYHYNGRADTYYHMGKAFGRGLLQILNNSAATRQRVRKARPKN
ncbi:predicted protein [Phaeodactylum tricornutum CCAP 1055/1]|uniref:Sialate O-acetylesterase domain-containing protein n=2 Tax=Phaeodactylum tricornutum TaxID=2850 RepID=B5Y539_PHATC|nr:predicted protein [Phaeodactylum tricornutum CCAP 1055/1]ACI65586.1 predicted protein [Phaeodactylum tricornutum CCAP 1055/1]|eukprot:XP_002186116.1 predicted protein [Phaeodactylum tricornutum CCAP 1055/1]